MDNELPVIDESVIEKPRELTKKDLKKEFKHLGGALLFNLVLQVFIAGLLSVVILAIAKSYGFYHVNYNLMLMVTLVFTLLCADTIPFFICAHRLKIKLRTYLVKPAISGAEMVRWFLIIMGIVAVYNLLSTALINTFPNIEFQQTGLEGFSATDWITLLMSYIAIAVIAPIFEEIAFRGLCLHVFGKYGTRFAIIASSMLFALLHGNVIQSLFAFGLGILLALLTLKAKSILPAIFVHFANNSIALIPVEWFVFLLFGIFILGGLFCYFSHRDIFKLDETVPNHRFCWDALMATPSILMVVIIYTLMIIFTTVMWFM